MPNLKGKVALVTGATRGIGKGIALQLGQNGAKVYITGRTLKSKDGTGCLESTAEEIKKRGGQVFPVQVDHENPHQIENLFKQIDKEQNGNLDILVNNAYKGVDTIFNNMKSKFWQSESPSKIWDDINNVGLRNHYFCTAYASRLMVPKKKGLIINISSFGGQTYIFNTAYGIGKVGVDRMAIDCGVELKKYNVASLSLMLGAVKTEKTSELISDKGDKLKLKGDPNDKTSVPDKSVKTIFEEGETVEFGGKIISHMATNPNIMKLSCKIIIASDYASKYNITDIDGRVIPSHRELRNLGALVLPKSLRPWAKNAPSWLKVPQFLLDIAGSKYYSI